MLGQCLIVTLISQGTIEEVLPALFYPLYKNAKHPRFTLNHPVSFQKIQSKNPPRYFLSNKKRLYVFPGTFQDDAYILFEASM